MLTPNDLEILIHYYVSPAEHPRFNYIRPTIDEFVRNGILERKDDEYAVTDKGRAWLISILQVPCPTQAWIDKNGNVIKEE